MLSVLYIPVCSDNVTFAYCSEMKMMNESGCLIILWFTNIIWGIGGKWRSGQMTLEFVNVNTYEMHFMSHL